MERIGQKLKEKLYFVIRLWSFVLCCQGLGTNEAGLAMAVYGLFSFRKKTDQNLVSLLKGLTSVAYSVLQREVQLGHSCSERGKQEDGIVAEPLLSTSLLGDPAGADALAKEQLPFGGGDRESADKAGASTF